MENTKAVPPEFPLHVPEKSAVVRLVFPAELPPPPPPHAATTSPQPIANKTFHDFI
jgi:hypothetical protein